MTDLSKTIAPKSDQLNSDDLISGPRTIRISKVSQWNAEQPIAINFDGDDGKPYLPCKSMRRVLVQIWGSDGASYVGRSMTLYRDPEVLWGGVKVGGIRISHMTNMEADIVMSLTASKKARAPFRVRALKVADQAPRQTSTTQDPATIYNLARSFANKGTDAFKAWLRTEAGKTAWGTAQAIKDELKALTIAADAAIAEDPFGLPPVDDQPTEAERNVTDPAP